VLGHAEGEASGLSEEGAVEGETCAGGVRRVVGLIVRGIGAEGTNMLADGRAICGGQRRA
jgi:hypothetical protein